MRSLCLWVRIFGVTVSVLLLDQRAVLGGGRAWSIPVRGEPLRRWALGGAYRVSVSPTACLLGKWG